MTSYRFKRRAFLSAAGGGVGLKVMLRNLEVAAQTSKSPARLLITHWPVGAVTTGWAPTSGSVGGSTILKPFADAGLAADMTVFRGLTTNQLASPGGGGHEAGTVKMMTGVACPGTRSGEPEQDDAYSGGPSVDQVFLTNVPALKPPGGGAGYANSICDSRVDVTEISTQCLSYSYNKSSVNSVQNGVSMQNSPQMPILSPLQQWNNLFMNFVPVTGGTTGGATTGNTTGVTTGNTTGTTGTTGRTTGGTTGTTGRTTGGASSSTTGAAMANAMLKTLANRKSVLDFALAELAELRKDSPAASQANIDIHTQAIRSVESQLTSSINTYGSPGTSTTGGTTGGSMGTTGRMTTTGGMTSTTTGGGNTTTGATTGNTTGGTTGTGVRSTCSTKPAQPSGTGAMGGSMGSPGTQYSPSVDGAKADDSTLHAAVGKLHTDIFKAAFICDILRVGTFQWSPGTNHVAFINMMPGETGTIYQHHPVSHRIGSQECKVNPLGTIAQFLANIHIWYNQHHAAIFADWKTTLDGLGNSLLDYTCVPFVTEVEDTGHGWTNMAAAIIGGKALGFTHNIYKTGSVTMNQYWGTVGQAFGYSGTAPVGAPIAGLWTKPA